MFGKIIHDIDSQKEMLLMGLLHKVILLGILLEHPSTTKVIYGFGPK